MLSSMRPRSRVLIILGMFLLIVMIASLGCSRTGIAFSKSILFVPQIFDLGIKPLEWVTPAPVNERVSFEGGGRTLEADVYRPGADGEFPAVLLFLGVAPADADDPRVVKLGEALARSGLVSLFYWSPQMSQGDIDVGDIANLVAAFKFLQDREYVDETRTGMGGFCVGASFVLIASSDEQIRDRIAFINLFGPYFDLRDVVVSVASEQTVYEGALRPWIPDKLTHSTFRDHLTKDLALNEGDAVRNVVNSESSLDHTDVYWSAEGLAVYRLLSGSSAVDAEELLLSIPQKTLRSMDEISPRHYVRSLRAPVLIMHDRDDSLIPVEESRRLVDSLKESADVTYTEYTNIFSHVSPTRLLGPDSMRDMFKFLLHMHAVMKQIT